MSEPGQPDTVAKKLFWIITASTAAYCIAVWYINS